MLRDIRIAHRLHLNGWSTCATLGGAFVEFSGYMPSGRARREAADILLHSPR